MSEWWRMWFSRTSLLRLLAIVRMMENVVFKDFTVKTARNCQNDGVCGKRSKDIYATASWNITVSAGVSGRGKTWIHFIDTNTNKVNSDNYIQLLNRGVFRDWNLYTLAMTSSFNKMGQPRIPVIELSNIWRSVIRWIIGLWEGIRRSNG